MYVYVLYAHTCLCAGVCPDAVAWRGLWSAAGVLLHLSLFTEIYPGARQCLEELSIRPHRSCRLHSASVCSFLYGCRGSEHRFFCLPSTSLAEPSPQSQVNISYIRPVATAGPEGWATHHENVMCKGTVCWLHEPFLGEGLTKYS